MWPTSAVSSGAFTKMTMHPSQITLSILSDYFILRKLTLSARSERINLLPQEKKIIRLPGNVVGQSKVWSDDHDTGFGILYNCAMIVRKHKFSHSPTRQPFVN